MLTLTLWLYGVSFICQGNTLHRPLFKSSNCKDIFTRSPSLSKMSANEEEESVTNNQNSEDDDSELIPGPEAEEPQEEVTDNNSEKSKNSDEQMRQHLAQAHGPGRCGNQECPRVNNDEAECQPCLTIYYACEICKKPETHKNDKTVLISKQNEKPETMSMAAGSFWEDPQERFLLEDGNNGNVAASTPHSGPGPSTATARAGGLLSQRVLASVLVSASSRPGLRTRRGQKSATSKEETWLVQLIKQVTNSCLLALDDTGTSQYRSGLVMSTDHWNSFMSDSFMTESLRVSNSLNIRPPENAGHNLQAVNWIRDILRSYETSSEEHSQCQEIARGDEQQNALIRDTLKFITKTLTDAGFFGSDTEELNNLLLGPEEFTIIFEKFFRTMSNIWSVLAGQERSKRTLQNKHKEMVALRASLSTELNNATSPSELDDIETRSRDACDQYEDSLDTLVDRLLVDWIEKTEIKPGIGLLTASLLFAGVEHHDPTENLQHCPVSGDSNHDG